MNIFKDKVAIVTGAASGIGKALSEELCRRGAIVVLTDWKEDQVCEVTDAIPSDCGSASSVCLDVTDYDAFKTLVDDTAKQFAGFSNQQKMHYKIHAANEMARQIGDFDLHIRLRPDLDIKLIGFDWRDLLRQPMLPEERDALRQLVDVDSRPMLADAV